MQKFDNINTFFNNIDNIPEVNDQICELLLFTMLSKSNRKINAKNPINKLFSKNNDGYIFYYNEKNISFNVLSELLTSKYDKEFLESKYRTEVGPYRTLKLACSLDLVNPKLIVGTTIYNVFSFLIEFEENGQKKVIDYNANLIMNKDDYYSIFNYQEINSVEKYELYQLYNILLDIGDLEHIYEYLLFSKEIFAYLSKKDGFKFLTRKYDFDGINMHNLLLLGDNHDALFFTSDDFFNKKYDDVIENLEEFTTNPNIKNKNIHFDLKTGKYVYNDEDFGKFNFTLLSDLTDQQEMKDILLSDERYGLCHDAVHFIAAGLSETNSKNIKVVAGKYKINDTDYYYHSWLELDDSVVIDPTKNLIVAKDVYYKLYEIVKISSLSYKETIDIMDYLEESQVFAFSPVIHNYFGNEIVKDLKKNALILK